jgi:transposase
MLAQPERPRVTVGVDTHKDIHVAIAKDHLGRRLGTLEVPATRAGYALLLAWARRLGSIEGFGIEGTGSYGAGLARYLSSRGVAVLEVSRPKRQDRRRAGKSDPADADAAASAVLSGDALGTPKSSDGPAEAIRALRVARQSAIKARTQAINAIRALVVSAPDRLREQLRSLPSGELVSRCCALRPRAEGCDCPKQATKVALQSLARRHQALDAEVAALDARIEALVAEAAPELVRRKGIKSATAAPLLGAAGDNPGRLRSEAAFAALCGSSPLDASSGKQVRHRLNRGGDRQANSALHMIVINRLSWDQATKDYMARRIAEGKTKREVIRCLKRYVAREVYKVLRDTAAEGPAALAA